MPICTVCVKSLFVRPSLWAAAFGAALIRAVPLTHEPGKFALVRAGLVLCNKLNCSLVNQRTQLEVGICCDLKQFLSDLNVENIDQGDHLSIDCRGD
jgi:hypothetical protein